MCIIGLLINCEMAYAYRLGLVNPCQLAGWRSGFLLAHCGSGSNDSSTRIVFRGLFGVKVVICGGDGEGAVRDEVVKTKQGRVVERQRGSLLDADQ